MSNKNIKPPSTPVLVNTPGGALGFFTEEEAIEGPAPVELTQGESAERAREHERPTLTLPLRR